MEHHFLLIKVDIINRKTTNVSKGLGKLEPCGLQKEWKPSVALESTVPVHEKVNHSIPHDQCTWECIRN